MKVFFKTLFFLHLSFVAFGQIDTASIRRTTITGQPIKIITDAHLRAASSFTIPYVNSVTPTMNGAINRAGYGLQLLSNGRLAIGAGSSSFFQFINFTELTTDLNLKANLASPTFTGTPLVPTATVGTNTAQAASAAFVQQEILADRVVNTTTTALTTSDLNTAYPSVKVGFRVICHLITGAPAIYTKATEAGTSDVWLTTSATVTP